MPEDLAAETFAKTAMRQPGSNPVSLAWHTCQKKHATITLTHPATIRLEVDDMILRWVQVDFINPRYAESGTKIAVREPRALTDKKPGETQTTRRVQRTVCHTYPSF